MKRAIAVLVAGAALLMGVGILGQEEKSEEQTGSDRYAELVQEKGEFRETWVLPGVDPGRYRKVFLWDGQFESTRRR